MAEGIMAGAVKEAEEGEEAVMVGAEDEGGSA